MTLLRRISFALLLVTIILLACACQQTEEEISYYEFSQAIESYDNESFFIPDTSGTDSEAAEDSNENEYSHGETTVGGILIKDKKYAYREQNVVIMSIENHTSDNYIVTITVDYLDKTSKLLKTESHSSQGLVSNGQTYLLFAPDIAFDSYRYSVEANIFEGKCYTGGLTFELSQPREVFWPIMEVTNDLMTSYPQIEARVSYISPEPINISTVTVFFGSDGEIFNIETHGMVAVYPGAVSASTLNLYYELVDKEDFKWPKELLGNTSVIVVVVGIGAVNETVEFAANVYPQFGTFQ